MEVSFAVTRSGGANTRTISAVLDVFARRDALRWLVSVRAARLAALSVFAATLAPGAARAGEPATTDLSHPWRFSRPDRSSDSPTFVQVDAGYGSSGFGVALGARIGTTYANGLYLAGSATYQPRESLPKSLDTAPPATVYFPAALLYAGIEAGYDVPVRGVVVRPYLGLGFAASSENASPLGAVGWLGVQVVYRIPERDQFVLLEVRGVGTTAQGDVADGSVGVFLGYGVPIDTSWLMGAPSARSR